MRSSAGMLAAVLVVFGAILTISGSNGGIRYALLPTWALLGIGYSAVMTPSGRLLRRSAGAADRPAVFAAQFALSHLCWLLTYPLAGWLGPAIGLAGTLFALAIAIVALAGAGLAWRLWPAADPEVVGHEHANLHPDHPHMDSEKRVHAHVFVIDDLHIGWP